MAADEQAAVVSGADIGEGLRRRYIPSQPAAALNPQREADDKKKQAKQVRMTSHDRRAHIWRCANTGLLCSLPYSKPSRSGSGSSLLSYLPPSPSSLASTRLVSRISSHGMKPSMFTSTWCGLRRRSSDIAFAT